MNSLRTETLSPQAPVAAHGCITIMHRVQQRVGARSVHNDFDVVSDVVAQENAAEVRYAAARDQTSNVAVGVYGAALADD